MPVYVFVVIYEKAKGKKANEVVALKSQKNRESEQSGEVKWRKLIECNGADRAAH